MQRLDEESALGVRWDWRCLLSGARTGFFFAISLAIALPVAVSAKTAALPPSSAFAYANQAGDLLLAPADLAKPERLTKAICPGGRVLRVQYLRRQTARPNDSGRPVSSNFASQASTVFRVQGGKVDEDATCLVAEEALLAGTSAVPLGPVDPSTACSAEANRRLAEHRGRAVTRCWPLRAAGRDARILLLEFERLGTAALASLALVTEAGIAFHDYPATYSREGGDLWRVEDGGEMSPEGFEVLFALRKGSSWILGVSWSSTESLSLSLLVSRDGRDFEELVHGDRYVAPR